MHGFCQGLLGQSSLSQWTCIQKMVFKWLFICDSGRELVNTGIHIDGQVSKANCNILYFKTSPECNNGKKSGLGVENDRK